MRKGELRKDAILNAAEKLFIEKGYEETSIQDILDALSLSKGGFYHYFESKIQLLEEITARRAEADVQRLRGEFASSRRNASQKMNLLFGAIQMLNRPDYVFSALALKVGYVNGDVNFRDRNRRFLLENLYPLADKAIFEGRADETFFVRDPQRIARIVMMMACDANDECCRILAANLQNTDCAIEIMSMFNAYQEAVENLLGARYGSIVFCEPELLVESVRQISDKLSTEGN